MTTPRIAFSGVHINAGDVLGAAASVCWLASWVLSRSRPMPLAAGMWPSVILTAAAASMPSSLDVRAAGLGLAELTVLWILPAVVVPNILSTPQRVTQFLTCISVGSLIAGTANLVEAIQVGTAGGLPQVWGAAQYFQGYFQVIALTIAVSRLLAAVAARRTGAALLWCLAGFVNASALLLTQTRGAWLAAIVAMIVLGILWRPSVLIGTIGVLLVVVLTFASADWASVVRERVQSTFTLEAGLSGFESSLGRLGLAVTAWRMFLAHPLLGVGLKNFTVAMPLYSPPGLPLAYEMGPNHILTPVEGPHSTYLSLLSEVGIVGLIGLLCWQGAAIRRLYRDSRASRDSRPLDGLSPTNAPMLLAGVIVVAVYNCFFEMNQTGTLIFVSLLALGSRPPTASPS